MTRARFFEIAKPFAESLVAAVLFIFAVATFFALAMSAAEIFGARAVLMAMVFAVVWNVTHKLLALRRDMQAHEAEAARYRASWMRRQPAEDTAND